MPLTDDFRVSVRRLLRERRMTQKDLAKLLGIKEPSISQLLTGEYQPSLQQVEKISKALHMRATIVLEPMGQPLEASAVAS